MLNARLQGILDTKIGFAGPVPYRTAPQTKYQKLMRGQREKIKDHYTPSRGPIEIEKYVLVKDGPLMGDVIEHLRSTSVIYTVCCSFWPYFRV